ncbi:MAG: sugar transferase [Kiritimatiellae bacterium]|nr:sugar transferase [Kiritimatiellia bacterium]
MITHRYYGHTQTLWMAVMDAGCMVAGIVFGVTLRLGFASVGGYIFGHMNGWLFLCGSMVLANYLVGNYGIQVVYSRFNLLVSGMFSLAVALLVLSFTSYAWFHLLVGRGVLALAIVIYSALWFLLRVMVYRILYRSKFFLCRVVMLGTGDCARRMLPIVENEAIFPTHQIVAFVRLTGVDADTSIPNNHLIDGRVVIETRVETLIELVRSLGVTTLIIGLEDQSEAAKFYPALRHLRFEGVEILTALSAAEMYSARIPLGLVDEAWLTQACMDSAMPVVRRLKRVFDVVVGLVGAVVFLPVAGLVALCIKLSAPGSPVIYSQARAGQFGKLFHIYKFRTMTDGAEEESGPVWAARDDMRITRLGRVLRKFRLDEIPQIVNILKGDMSIVGPRPERPEIIADLEQAIPFYRERLNIMPGLTGWAQIRYPYTNTVQDAARKLEFDLYYIKYLSMRLDIQIILSTIRIVLFGLERRQKGAPSPAGGQSSTSGPVEALEPPSSTLS